MPQTQTYAFRFTGDTHDYFRLCLGNIVRTILTLGLYGGQARVSQQRWFHLHTLLDGVAFEYLATPRQHFQRQLFAAGLIGLIVSFVVAHPLLTPLALLACALALPWLVVNVLRFRAHHTAYRGVRFHFSGSVDEAIRVFLFWPLGVLASCGLLLPVLAWRVNRFLTEHTHYGAAPTHYLIPGRSFIGVYLKMLGLAVVMVIPYAAALVVLFVLVSPGLPPVPSGVRSPDDVAYPLLFAPLAIVFYLPVIGAFMKARTAQLCFNGAVFLRHPEQAGTVSFVCGQRARDLVWLYASNLLGVSLSLGLLIPWAQVRLARYRAAQLTLVSAVPLVRFAPPDRAQSALSTEPPAPLRMPYLQAA